MTSSIIRKMLLLWVVAVVTAVQVDHLKTEADDSVFFKILDSMMQRYQLPKSKQIPNCFSNTQRDALAQAVFTLTSTAAEADSTGLRKFP